MTCAHKRAKKMAPAPSGPALRTRLLQTALLSTLIGTLSACQGYWDADGDGFSVTEGDCNDESASTGPLALELCDGIDQNCNGLIDESADATDLDNDGFISAFSGDCPTADYQDLLQGDCREGDALTHPGAEDEPGDTMDSDCGGTDGPDPHVGLNDRSVSLASALSAVSDGATIWLGPSDLRHTGLVLPPISHTLRSVGQRTRILSDDGAPGLTFEGDGDATLTLEDIALVGGISTSGGSLKSLGGQLVLTQVTLQDGSASREGGCLALYQTLATLDHVSFDGCTAGSAGGGIYVQSGSLTMTDVQVESCGLMPDALGEGGGLRATDSRLELTRVALLRNFSPGSGGGLSQQGGSALLQNVSMLGNQAGGLGGGALVREPEAFSFLFGLVVSNRAASGAGLLLQTLRGEADLEGPGALFQVRNSILAFNIGRNLTLSAPEEGVLELLYSDVYSVGGQSYGLKQLDRSNLEVYPGFARFTNDLDSTNDDLHLHPASPLLDAGDPLLTDPDGSRADLGPGGGPEADRVWYADADSDGLPDGWELRSSFDLSVLSAASDPDADGASAKDELQKGLAPFVADTDEDGFSDGDELAASTDAADWFSRPGEPYPVTVRISTQEPLLQETLNRIAFKGRIELDPGTWRGPVVVEGRDVVLIGAYGASRTVLQGDEAGSSIQASQATFRVEGVSLVGGEALAGAGMNLSNVDASLYDVRFLDNKIVDSLSGQGGAAIYLTGGSMTLESCRFEGQSASAPGGALYANASELELQDVSFEGIWAERDGGAIYLNGSELSGEALEFISIESEDDGGAIAAQASQVALRDVFADQTRADALAGMGGFLSLSGGTADLENLFVRRAEAEHGGALAISGGSLRAENLWLEDCSAKSDGAGVVLEEQGYADVRNLVVLRGVAERGAGVSISCATGVFQNLTLTGGDASLGGGIFVAGTAPLCPPTALQLTNAIVAFNLGYNLYVDEENFGSVGTTYSDFYAATGEPNHNLPSLVGGNLVMDPSFLAMGSDGVPMDVHLGQGSGLKDVGSPLYYDLDGSRSDPGAFGGAQGGGFDLDRDGFPGYFWPGEYGDAPETVKSYLYDCKDRDALVQVCDE